MPARSIPGALRRSGSASRRLIRARVVIELVHPAPYLLDLLVHRAFPVPRHVVEKWGREWTRAGRIVSNGAFVLGEWRPGSHVKLVRNPAFHEASTVKLDAVYHVPVEDPKARRCAAFGRASSTSWSRCPRSRSSPSRRDFGSQLHLVQQIGLEYLAFNTRRPPFSDARVRRALSMAIDRELLTKRILRAGEPAAYCLVPPGVDQYPNPGCADFSSWPQPRRLDVARRLLAAAGYGPGGRALALRYALQQFRHAAPKMALAVSAMWQPLGVRTELRDRGHEGAPAGARAGGFRRGARVLVCGGSRSGLVPRRCSTAAPAALNLSGMPIRPTTPCSIGARRFRTTSCSAPLLAEAEAPGHAAQPIAPLYYYVSAAADRRRGCAAGSTTRAVST